MNHCNFCRGSVVDNKCQQCSLIHPDLRLVPISKLKNDEAISSFDQFAEEMRQIDQDGHGAWRHEKMDELMCKLLRKLGYSQGIDIFERKERHYSAELDVYT